MPHLAQELLPEMKSFCLVAPRGEILEEIITVSFLPSIRIVPELFDDYGMMGNLTKNRTRNLTIYMMDLPSKQPVDIEFVLNHVNVCGSLSIYICCIYLLFTGIDVRMITIPPLWTAIVSYRRHRLRPKSSLWAGDDSFSCSGLWGQFTFRLLLEKEGTKAISFAYIKGWKFYKLSDLQREFVRMVEAGFRHYITTFNLQALTFSRSSLLWDLHLSLGHIKYEQISPNLLSLAIKRGFKLYFEQMNLDDSPVVLTDPFVSEIWVKGTQSQARTKAFLEQYRRDRILLNY
ncbi:hypothetical protein I3843_15G134000 [Carya illinoinensis]|nr:hypothetical protein I3843_15G134000 [Carya illinoinensis]